MEKEVVQANTCCRAALLAVTTGPGVDGSSRCMAVILTDYCDRQALNKLEWAIGKTSKKPDIETV
jgi:hypothetical protein